MNIYSGNLRRVFFSATALAAMAAAGAAGAQNSDLEAARAILREAEGARADALRALERADAAMKNAQAIIERATTPLPQPAKSEAWRTMPECGASVPASDAMLRDPNTYVAQCLGMASLKDYSIGSLNGQIRLSSNDGVLELVPEYTFFYRPKFKSLPGDDRLIRWKSLTWKLGPSVPIETGKKDRGSLFADLSQPDLSDDIGGIGGIEFRWGRSVTWKAAREELIKGLATAQRDCIAFHLSKPFGDDVASLTAPTLRDAEAAAQNCRGAGLTEWVRGDEKRRQSYYEGLVAPLWGHAKQAQYWIGAEARYARPELSYVPLIDPGKTGVPLLTVAPSDISAVTVKRRESLYSAKFYAGISPIKDFSLVASIAYRRDRTFPPKTEAVSLCPIDGTLLPGQSQPMIMNQVQPLVSRCSTSNIAPYTINEGWVAGGRIAYQAGRKWLFPNVAIAAKATYAFDTDQLGFEVPLTLIGEDKSPGGVQLSCTTKGSTRFGAAIGGKCDVVLFYGVKFDLNARP